MSYCKFLTLHTWIISKYKLRFLRFLSLPSLLTILSFSENAREAFFCSDPSKFFIKPIINQ